MKNDLSVLRYIIRQAFMKSMLRRQALVRARIDRGRYQCAGCKRVGGVADLAIDHISPVTPPETGFVDWNTYVARLFCDPGNLQALCKACHAAKTAAEQGERKKHGTGIYGRRKDSAAHLEPYTTRKRKPIRAIRLSDGETRVFTSGLAASKALGVSRGHISEVCAGKRKSIGGYRFEYVEPKQS